MEDSGDKMAKMDKLMKEVESVLRSRAAMEVGSEHLAIEDIVSYHEKALAPERHEAAQEHLASCGECTALLLDLESFEQLGPPPGHDSDTGPDLAALRGSLEQRLRAEDVPQKGKLLPLAPRVRRARISPVYWAALAALFVAVVGLAARVWLPSALPEGNTETFLLAPTAYRNDADQTFRVPTWTSTYVLTLGSVTSLGHDTVAAEIRDASGRVVLRAEALHRAADDTLKWSLSRTRLPSGTYEILLIGPQDEPLDAYEFTLILEGTSD